MEGHICTSADGPALRRSANITLDRIVVSDLRIWNSMRRIFFLSSKRFKIYPLKGYDGERRRGGACVSVSAWTFSNVAAAATATARAAPDDGCLKAPSSANATHSPRGLSRRSSSQIGVSTPHSPPKKNTIWARIY